MKSHIVLMLWMVSWSLSAQMNDISGWRLNNVEDLSQPENEVLPAEEPVQEDWTVFGAEGEIHFSEQTSRLIADSNFRHETYPVKYELNQIPDLLEQQRVMLTLWTMINLYPSNREEVKTIALMLARRGIRGQHYLSAFYTYVFADPQVFHHRASGLPYLEYPLVMERKMEACRALASYTEGFAKRLSTPNQQNRLP